MAASGLKSDLGSFFAGYIRRAFIEPKPEPTALHKAMLKLERLQFVVTTNYDSLIERTFRQRDPDVTVCTFKDAGEVRRSLSSRDFLSSKPMAMLGEATTV